MALPCPGLASGGDKVATVFGFLFFCGIVVAGSDGPLFPWANAAGLVVSYAALVGVNKTRKGD